MDPTFVASADPMASIPITSRLLPALLLGCAVQAASGAGAPVAVHLGPGSTLRVSGTSTVHDWESTTTATAVSITRRPGAGPADFPALVHASAIQDVDVRVPVRSLHSPRKGLDANLYKALKADAHPTIEVHLDRSTAAKAAAGDTTHVTASGTIRVAGVERPVTLEARLHPGDGGTWLVGTNTLRMSDFGIKPPTMMMGTLRVRDPVTIRYRLLLLP